MTERQKYLMGFGLTGGLPAIKPGWSRCFVVGLAYGRRLLQYSGYYRVSTVSYAVVVNQALRVVGLANVPGLDPPGR